MTQVNSSELGLYFLQQECNASASSTAAAVTDAVWKRQKA